MKILSVNAGSSSLKFQMYEMPEEQVLISGNFERIGTKESFYTMKLNGEKIEKQANLNDHVDAVKILASELIQYGIIDSLDEIKGIGHRIVHGGDLFDKSVIATEEVIEQIASLSTLAPLHNPAAVKGIHAFKQMIPNATMTAVFDTAFHQTMAKESYIYAVPYEWYVDYKVRRYGAHGTSHKYVSQRLSALLGRDDTKLITCHLGNGASISAIKNGKCIDTSMGFTPNAGLIMGSRCGDMDASILPFMMEQTGMTPKEMDTVLNKKSGLLGIGGVSNDYRDIEKGVQEGNERCILAKDMFIRSAVSFIAKYYVLLGGCDAICFTAGIGENGIHAREAIMKSLEPLGVVLNETANQNVHGETLISALNSNIPCYVIPTNEELMIARDTYELIG